MQNYEFLLRPPIHTLFIGKTHIHLTRVESTNSWLKESLESHNTAQIEGLVVTADDQFAGKGQQQKQWISEPGQNLIASILLLPKFLAPHQVFYLNKAVALAVRDALSTFVDNVTIKWPNDIYYHKMKLAGILMENVLGANKVQQSIVGIGINVNQTSFNETLVNPISLKGISGNVYDRSEILAVLCSQLEKYYLQLRNGQFEIIDALYHNYLLGLNTEQSFIYKDKKIQASILRVSPAGKLILSASTEKLELELGEIVWILE